MITWSDWLLERLVDWVNRRWGVADESLLDWRWERGESRDRVESRTRSRLNEGFEVAVSRHSLAISEFCC